MKRILAIAALLLASTLHAQTTLIVANVLGIRGADGNPIANGKITMAPTDSNGNPLNVNLGANHGFMVPRPVTCLISNGAITNTVTGLSCTVVDTTLTNPANFCYKTTIVDTVTGWTAPVIACMQPSGATWDIYDYAPTAPTALLTLSPIFTGGSSGQLMEQTGMNTAAGITGSAIDGSGNVTFPAGVTAASSVIGTTRTLPGGTQPAGTLQAAINAAGANSTLVIPAGYSETPTSVGGTPIITLTAANVTIEASPGATITKGSNGTLLAITGSGDVVRGGVWDGNRAGGFTGDNIDLTGSTNAILDNVLVRNATGENVTGGNFSGALLTGLNVYGGLESAVSFNASAGNITSVTVTDSILDSTTATSSSSGKAVELHSGSGINSISHVFISKNHLRNGLQWGVEWGAFSGAPTHDIHVTDNDDSVQANTTGCYSSGALSYGDVVENNTCSLNSYTATVAAYEIVQSLHSVWKGNSWHEDTGQLQIGISLNSSSYDTIEGFNGYGWQKFQSGTPIGAIAAADPWANQITGLVGSISGTTLTITTAGSHNLLPGLTVVGTGVSSGTFVVGYGTGTGGTGTYTVSISQTVSSESLTAGSYVQYNTVQNNTFVLLPTDDTTQNENAIFLQSATNNGVISNNKFEHNLVIGNGSTGTDSGIDTQLSGSPATLDSNEFTFNTVIGFGTCFNRNGDTKTRSYGLDCVASGQTYGGSVSTGSVYSDPFVVPAYYTFGSSTTPSYSAFATGNFGSDGQGPWLSTNCYYSGSNVWAALGSGGTTPCGAYMFSDNKFKIQFGTNASNANGQNPGQQMFDVTLSSGTVSAGPMLKSKGAINLAPLDGPAAPTVAANTATGTCSTSTTYYYLIQQVNAFGHTANSTEISIAPSIANESIQVNWTPQTGDTSTVVYRGTSSGAENVYVSVTEPAHQYVDSCSSLASGSPTNANTSQPPFYVNGGSLGGGYFLRSNSGGAGYTESQIQSSDIPNNAANTTGTAGGLTGTPALPNGTTATTQSSSDNSTKVATTAYVQSNIPSTNPVYTPVTCGSACVNQSNSLGTISMVATVPGTNWVEYLLQGEVAETALGTGCTTSTLTLSLDYTDGFNGQAYAKGIGFRTTGGSFNTTWTAIASSGALTSNGATADFTAVIFAKTGGLVKIVLGTYTGTACSVNWTYTVAPTLTPVLVN